MKAKLRPCTVAVAILMAITCSASAIDPPKGLQWGQTHAEVKSALKNLPKDKRFDVKDPETNDNLPLSFRSAELKDVKLFDEKAKEAQVVFDSTGGLCAVQYAFAWENKERTTNIFESANKGRDKSWAFYNELLQALYAKYGEPVSSVPAELQGQDVVSGTKLRTEWVDQTTDDKIILVMTRQKRNAVIARIDNYIVVLLYHSPAYTEAKKDEIRASDDI